MSELIKDYAGQRDHAFREEIYQGTVLRIPPSAASTALVQTTWQRIVASLGSDPRCAQFNLTAKEYFQVAGQLRRELYLSDKIRGGIADLLSEVGADAAAHVCDPARLRVVTVGGHHNPAAAPVYYAHRDTWYSNPQEQITWWMPLHRVEQDETFEFLPECFDVAVGNDSAGFDYDRWTSKGSDLKIGWQDPAAGQRELYPQLRETLTARRLSFAANPGEVIVFSGQHLHQTIPIESGLTRFSLDFRTVHLDDHCTCRGPKNVDNRSTGSALVGHVPVEFRSLRPS